MRMLGKKPRRNDKRTLWFHKYVPPVTPVTPPETLDLTPDAALPWGMDLNDHLSICTCAAVAHLEQTWTGNAGKPVIPADSDVENFYERFGYSPADPSTDQGAVELDVLNSWRKQGMAALPPLGAYAAVNEHDQTEVMSAASRFEGLYIGIQLPLTAHNQAATWDVTDPTLTGDAAPGSWGGHAVCVVGYDAHFVYVVTWGQVVAMTWAFWMAYVDEAYALISQDELNPQGLNEAGLNLDQLQADLEQVTA